MLVSHILPSPTVRIQPVKFVKAVWRCSSWTFDLLIFYLWLVFPLSVKGILPLHLARMLSSGPTLFMKRRAASIHFYSYRGSIVVQKENSNRRRSWGRGGGTLLLHQHSLTTRHTNIGWWELFIGEENGGIFDPAGEISSSSSSPLLFCSRRKERRLLYARTMTTTLTYLVSFEKPRNRRGGIYIIIIGWKSLTLPYSSSKLLLFHVFLLLL